ncbi:MAG: DUF3109 family protein [Hyphomicrobiales bacterium]
MIVIGDTIVSEDIARIKFCCNLAMCKGECCVEGDSGAPLEELEIPILEEIYEEVKPYMTEEGINVIESNGSFDYDEDGDYATPLVNNQECAYVNYKNGVTYCAIEKAYLDGKIDWKKPISCHLYPVRLSKYKEFIAVNYHKWSICSTALKKGHQSGVPLFEYLKEPLTRQFGEEWYDTLCKEIRSGKYDDIINK